jgi:hypothetical protein
MRGGSRHRRHPLRYVPEPDNEVEQDKRGASSARSPRRVARCRSPSVVEARGVFMGRYSTPAKRAESSRYLLSSIRKTAATPKSAGR